jgi:hypothetical protein
MQMPGQRPSYRESILERKREVKKIINTQHWIVRGNSMCICCVTIQCAAESETSLKVYSLVGNQTTYKYSSNTVHWLNNERWPLIENNEPHRITTKQLTEGESWWDDVREKWEGFFCSGRGAGVRREREEREKREQKAHARDTTSKS